MLARNLAVLLFCTLLGACAGPADRRLEPGRAEVADIVAVMGQPRMQWTNPDGSLRLAFPRGPAGTHTYMADFGADGKLQRIENVLTPTGFSRIAAGMNEEQVLRVLGPPEPSWTLYFKARDELVWEWRYCDDWNEPARFNVLFDATQAVVRSTLSLTESQLAYCGGGDMGGRCWCGH